MCWGFSASAARNPGTLVKSREEAQDVHKALQTKKESEDTAWEQETDADKSQEVDLEALFADDKTVQSEGRLSTSSTLAETIRGFDASTMGRSSVRNRTLKKTKKLSTRNEKALHDSITLRALEENGESTML